MPAVENGTCDSHRCGDTFSLFQASGQPLLSRMRGGSCLVPALRSPWPPRAIHTARESPDIRNGGTCNGLAGLSHSQDGVISWVDHSQSHREGMPFQESQTKHSWGCFCPCLPSKAKGLPQSHTAQAPGAPQCPPAHCQGKVLELGRASRGWLHFIRLQNSVVKGAGSELTTFGSVPEQLAREAYQAPVIGFDLNLSPSHHPFWIKSSPPNERLLWERHRQALVWLLGRGRER